MYTVLKTYHHLHACYEYTAFLVPQHFYLNRVCFFLLHFWGFRLKHCHVNRALVSCEPWTNHLILKNHFTDLWVLIFVPKDSFTDSVPRVTQRSSSTHNSKESLNSSQNTAWLHTQNNTSHQLTPNLPVSSESLASTEHGSTHWPPTPPSPPAPSCSLTAGKLSSPELKVYCSAL